MKGIIEQEIEEFADKTGEYPKRVEVSQKEWDILQNELKRELIELNTKSIIFINEDNITFPFFTFSSYFIFLLFKYSSKLKFDS